MQRWSTNTLILNKGNCWLRNYYTEANTQTIFKEYVLQAKHHFSQNEFCYRSHTCSLETHCSFCDIQYVNSVTSFLKIIPGSPYLISGIYMGQLYDSCSDLLMNRNASHLDSHSILCLEDIFHSYNLLYFFHQKVRYQDSCILRKK
jgi:hypothetical protein